MTVQARAKAERASTSPCKAGEAAGQGSETRPSAQEQEFGRIRVVITAGGEVVLHRAGVLGRGSPRTSRLWHEDQIFQALINAENRKGTDAVDEAKALRWAIQTLRPSKPKRRA